MVRSIGARTETQPVFRILILQRLTVRMLIFSAGNGTHSERSGGTGLPFTITFFATCRFLIAGLLSKKPKGTRLKPSVWVFMIGHSSGRTICVIPRLYQTTRSLPTRFSLSRVHSRRPSLIPLEFGYSPAECNLYHRSRSVSPA